MSDPRNAAPGPESFRRYGDEDEEEALTNVGAHPQPAPAAATRRDRAYLIVIAGRNVGQMFRIVGREVIIGRAADVTVRIFDDNISRRHARLVVERDGQLHVTDLGSANGTRVNGEPIKERVLRDGDKLELGSTTVLKFTYHDELDEQFQRNMYDAAQRDGLTNAFNKRYFLDRLGAEMAYAQRHHSNLALVLLDADHFKRINDVYGHVAGDQVLVRLATLATSTIRVEDVFARYGGEEFAIICRGVTVDGAAALGDRLRRVVESGDFSYEGRALDVRISVGVAGFPDSPVTSGEELVTAADTALYEAKRAGRNRVVKYVPAR